PPTTSNKLGVRIDHNFSENSRLFGRYSNEQVTWFQNPSIFGLKDPADPSSLAPNPRWDLGLGFTHVFDPTLVMSVNLGANRWIERFLPHGEGFKPSTLGLPSLLD